jgi:hypothetical protein
MATPDADLPQIQAAITRVAHDIDAARWPELRALFDDDVQTDYTSLFGGEAQDQRADDLIGAWRTLLAAIVTQHFLGPIEVEVTGDVARAECHVRGYHVKQGAPGGDEWMVAGHYVFELRRRGAGWKIRKMKLVVIHQTGNLKLLQGGQSG